MSVASILIGVLSFSWHFCDAEWFITHSNSRSALEYNLNRHHNKTDGSISNPLSDILDTMPPFSSTKDPLIVSFSSLKTAHYRIFKADDEAWIVDLRDGSDVKVRARSDIWLLEFDDGEILSSRDIRARVSQSHILESLTNRIIHSVAQWEFLPPQTFMQSVEIQIFDPPIIATFDLGFILNAEQSIVHMLHSHHVPFSVRLWRKITPKHVDLQPLSDESETYWYVQSPTHLDNNGNTVWGTMNELDAIALNRAHLGQFQIQLTLNGVISDWVGFKLHPELVELTSTNLEQFGQSITLQRTNDMDRLLELFDEDVGSGELDNALLMTENDCAICLESMNNGTEAVLALARCAHKFHSDCLQQWLRQREFCPLCKRKSEIEWQIKANYINLNDLSIV